MDDIYNELIIKLSNYGIESPRLEARLLLSHVLGCDISEINSQTKISNNKRDLLKKMTQRRCQHEPLDKILGHKEFYKYDFIVNNKVLSPRPDTEIMVEKVLEYANKYKELRILDLGTGSGCIIETLLKELSEATGVAVDSEKDALYVAEKNACNLNITDRLKFIKADWFEDNFTQKISSVFDIIVTNPPYIPTNDILGLSEEVKNYDPIKALDGGDDGYKSYRRIAQISGDLLKDNGLIFIEAGINQAQSIISIFERKGFKFMKCCNDLSGISRCVIMKKDIAEL